MSTSNTKLAPSPPPGVPRRVALVTGSSSGIGVAIARQLGYMGFNVGLTRMPNEDTTTVTKLARQLQDAYGVEAEIFITDLSDPESACTKLMKEHVARFGRLDVLASNAGWAAHAGRPFMKLPEGAPEGQEVGQILAKVRSGFAVNFESPLILSWLAVEQFRKQSPPDPTEKLLDVENPDLDAAFYTRYWGIGRIINTSSVHDITPLPMSSIYTCTKHALRGLTVFLASELGQEGITVNSVAPGMIATPQTEIRPEDVEQPEYYSKGLAVPRPGRPAEAASAVGYLASVGARYTTGQTIYVDGGFTFGNPQFFWKFP